MSLIHAALRFALTLLQPATVPTLPSACTGSLQGRALRTEFIGGVIFAHWRLRNGEDLRFYLDPVATLGSIRRPSRALGFLLTPPSAMATGSPACGCRALLGTR